jgi:predicted ATPase
MLATAAMEGADVLAGRAFEAGGRLPYGPLVDALRERLARENAPEDLLDDVWLAELSRLLPELRERYPHLSPAEGDAAMARTQLFEAVARLGQALAQRSPLIFFVDDLQWTDEATLHLLHYAARRWAESSIPLLLLLAVRAEALAEAPLAGWIIGLERDLGTTSISLGPLHAKDVTQLVELLAGGAVEETRRAIDACGRWLFSETQGQPFYVLETLKALLDRGLILMRQAADGTWEIELPATTWAADTAPGGLLPSGVREVIHARLAGLTPAGIALLTAGAVLGHGFRFDRLRQVAELDENTALAALDEVLLARLWQQTAVAGAHDLYDFRHDKVREVAYTEASEARRRIYHRRALALLEREAVPPAERAHHALLAGDEAAAIRHSIEAGVAALALFAVADAIAHFEQAHALLHDTAAGERMRIDAADGEVARLYLQLGRAYELNNDLPAAGATYKELGAIAEQAGRPSLQAMALTHQATVTMQGAWDRETALGMLRQALTLAEAGGDLAALAETEWTLAQVKVYSHDTKSALEHGERALSLARSLGLQELVARCLNVIAFAAMLLGHNERSLEASQEARTLYAATDNRVLEADALRMMAAATFQRGEAREAITLARRARHLSEEASNLWGRAWSAKELVAGLLDIGAYAAALVEARAALELARTLAEPMGLLMALTLVGRACRTVYALDDATTYQREALAVNEAMPAPPFTELICADLCASAALARDWEAAAIYARRALAERDYTFHLDTGLTRWLEIAALLLAGNLALAEADLLRFKEHGAQCKRYHIPYLRGLALVAEARGEIQNAISYLLDAATLAEVLGLPGEAWQIDAALAALYAGPAPMIKQR